MVTVYFTASTIATSFSVMCSVLVSAFIVGPSRLTSHPCWRQLESGLVKQVASTFSDWRDKAVHHKNCSKVFSDNLHRSGRWLRWVQRDSIWWICSAPVWQAARCSSCCRSGSPSGTWWSTGFHWHPSWFVVCNPGSWLVWLALLKRIASSDFRQIWFPHFKI